MDYNDLIILIKQKKLQLDEVCKEIGITPEGFRKGIERKSLAFKYIKPTCEALGISPNELFSWEELNTGSSVYASNISGINTQNSNEAIKALKDQLKEKDRQISRLMTMLEKRDGLSSEDGAVYPYMAAEGNNKGREKK